MITAELKKKWVDALRSKKYQQGTGCLKQDTQQGIKHCCLGVLCDVLDNTKWKKLPSEGNYDWYAWNGNSLRYLPPELQLGPIAADGAFESALMTMNDNGKNDFNMISDYIEKNLKTKDNNEAIVPDKLVQKT